jgi:hypothetical protein
MTPTLTAEATPTLIPEPTRFPDDTAMPPTPPPPTSTPLLPEEGGPPGGVLGGHTYVDTDGDGKRSDSDGVSGGTIFAELLGSQGEPGAAYVTVTNMTGSWQIRALPDGDYRVSWPPPVPPELFWKTIPPAQPYALTTIETVYRVTTTVEMAGANRVLDIDFGVPYQPPVPGTDRPQLPAAGQGAGGGVLPSTLLAGALVTAALIGVFTARRRLR